MGEMCPEIQFRVYLKNVLIVELQCYTMFCKHSERALAYILCLLCY